MVYEKYNLSYITYFICKHMFSKEKNICEIDKYINFPINKIK